MLVSDAGARMHVDHCIEHIRLALMCHGDTTPYFTIRDPDAPLGARSDFSPHRKCRDFGSIQSFMHKHGVKESILHSPERS